MMSILQVYTKVEKFGNVDQNLKQTKSSSIAISLKRKKYSKNRLGIKRRIPSESEENVALKTNFLSKFLRFAKFFKLG